MVDSDNNPVFEENDTVETFYCNDPFKCNNTDPKGVSDTAIWEKTSLAAGDYKQAVVELRANDSKGVVPCMDWAQL